MRDIAKQLSHLRSQNQGQRVQLELFREAVEHMHHGLCMFDKDGRVALCNNGYAEVLQLPPDRVRPGVTIRELIELGFEAGFRAPGATADEIEQRLWANLTSSDTRSTMNRGGRTYAVQPRRTSSGNWVATFEDITAQLTAETALRESEARLRTIIDAMPDCVKIFDEAGTLIYINPKGLELLQAPDLESLAAPGVDSVAPEHLAMKADVHRRVMAGETVMGTYEILGLEGRRRHVEAHAVPFRMPDGSRAHLCITRDISERVEAHEAQRRSDERLRLVHEATGLADFEAGPDRIDHISEAFREQAGLGPDVTELSMSEWFTIVHPDDRAHLLETIEQSLAKTGSFEGEYRIVRQDTGEVRWISSHTRMELDEAGRQARSIGAHLDITERKRAEEALRESEGRLRAILNAMPDCVKIFDESGQLIHINPQGLELLQAPDLASLSSTPGYTPVPPEYLPACVDVHRRVMAGESVVWTYEVIGLRGRRRHVEAHAVPFLMPDGAKVHLCISRDVNERKEADDALRRSEERLRLVQEATGLADFEAGVDGKAHFSPNLLKQMGLPEDGPTVLAFDDWIGLVHQDDREQLRLVEQNLKHSDTAQCEFRILRADDGEIRWISSSLRMERDGAGNVLRTIGAHFDITERKLAEEELRASAERLRLVHEATGLADYEISPERVAICSDRFFEQCGLPVPADRTIDFAEWIQIVHPDDREWLAAEIGKARAETDTFGFQFRIVRADNGETRWISSRSRIERDPSGRVVRTIGAHLDITDQKRAHEALRASEERLRVVQDATGLADFEIDAHGLATCSDRFLEQLGLPVGDSSVGTRGWTHLVHPDDRDRIAKEIADAHEQRQEWSRSEFRIVRADNGETRWITCSTKMERDEHGGLIRMIGGHLDITERKEAENALRRSEERLRLVQEATGLAHFESEPDCISQISDRFIEQTGLPPGTRSITPEVWNEIIHPDDRERFNRAVAKSIKEHDHLECEFRIIRPDNGETRWLYSRCKIERDETGTAYKSIGAHLDITERKCAEEALRESEERFRLATEATGLGVWDYDPTHDRREWSDRLRQIFGIGYDVEPSLEVAEACMHPADRAKFVRMLVNARDNDIGRFEASFRIRRACDGAERWVAMNGWRTFKTDSKLRRIIMTVRDVTDEKSADERVRWTASHDPLTRLANRSLFQEKLEQAIRAATADGGAVGLLVLDLDHFKQINDTLGHDAGDMLLKMFAERLRGVIRAQDTVARFGGDEFAIVMPDIHTEQSVIQLSRSIQDRLREPFVHGGRILDCRVSMGASVFPAHGRTSEELLKNADVALYAAKAGGRGMVSLFEPHMRDDVQRRSSMVQLARNAIRDDRIVPYYQPKLDLGTRSIVGFEALLRWRTPRGRIGLPAAIEAAFEDLEVAAAISDRMIERVIADMRGWLDKGIAFQNVAVNASAAEFRRDNFAERVLEQLRAANIPTRCFQLEVTETVFLGRGAEYVHRALALLNSRGVKIALDDFGTGYASLRHLKQFPVDIIKIDQSFVRDMAIDPGDEAIINAVINLGRSLGIKVVAEGIETAEQARRLLELECDFGQGFLFSKAVPASRVPALVEQCPASSPGRPAQRLETRDLRLVANRN